jgi:hypothetical protein
VGRLQFRCGNCRTRNPANPKGDGWGYEYKSATTVLGIPLVHVAFKYAPNGLPVPARGIVAIGQFAVGAVTISQFGLGLLSLSQITVAGLALTQVGAAYSLIAQVGTYLHSGVGQHVLSLVELAANI